MAFADNFEQALKDFFFYNHPRQAKKIPQIVAEFKGQEVEAMLWLCKKYGVDPSTIEGLKSAQASQPAPAPVVEAPAVEESAPEAEAAVEEVTEEEEVVAEETSDKESAEESEEVVEEEEKKEE